MRGAVALYMGEGSEFVVIPRLGRSVHQSDKCMQRGSNASAMKDSRHYCTRPRRSNVRTDRYGYLCSKATPR